MIPITWHQNNSIPEIYRLHGLIVNHKSFIEYYTISVSFIYYIMANTLLTNILYILVSCILVHLLWILYECIITCILIVNRNDFSSIRFANSSSIRNYFVSNISLSNYPKWSTYESSYSWYNVVFQEYVYIEFSIHFEFGIASSINVK